MNDCLTQSGYEQTKEKLASLEVRLAALTRRTDISQQLKSEARQSYERMINQYQREIKLYEAIHPEALAKH